MRGFNLLPVEAVRKRRRRRVNICLITAQAGVFLFAALSFPAFNMINSSVANRSAELEAIVNDEKYNESDRLFNEISRLKGITETRDSVISSFNPIRVDYETAAAVNKTVPENSKITYMEIDGTGVEIICLTNEIEVIETHRKNILAEDVFKDVTLFGISAEGDSYRYILQIGAADET